MRAIIFSICLLAASALGQGLMLDNPVLGLVGHWTFNEGGGSVANDSSGYGNTGYLTNSPTWTNGPVSGALYFDGSGINGTGPVVGIGINNLPATNNDRTIAAWVNPKTTVGYAPILTYGTPAAGNGFIVSWNNSSPHIIVGRFGANTPAQNSTTFSTGVWQHVCVVLSNQSSISYFYNGHEDGTTTLASINTVVASGVVGNCLTGWGVTSFCGNIDDVRIYNRALTAAEVLRLYNGGCGTER